MLDRILIALDGSRRAEAILPQVARLLKRKPAEYIAVRALPRPIGGYPGVDLGTFVEEDRKAAKAYMNDLSSRLAHQDLRFQAVVKEGHPAEVILDAAREHHADLIALTTHGRSGIARWALGSVAEKVIRGADAPVLLLRSFRPEGSGWSPMPAPEAPFRKILLPVDETGAAEAALPHAVALANEFSAEVVALHVVPESPDLALGRAPVPHEAPRDPVAVASLLSGRLTDAKVRSRAAGTRGDPASKILEVAASEGADLVVMATHGRTGLSRLGFGSVTERVLRGSTLPMLVVRAGSAA
jgi:nucleotide-binding universal stress UspA family protein